MKGTIVNRIKLWWHCLTNLHQEFGSSTSPYLMDDICCWNCKYGEDKDLAQIKEELGNG